MSEAKPRSYRIDDETTAKIKEITDTIGEGQQVAFARMVEAYHMQQSKMALGDERANVEQFEGYVSIINRMYMDAMESKNYMRENVRTEFEDMLRSKDEIIQVLQDKNKKMTREKELAQTKAAEYQNETMKLYGKVAELEKKNQDQMTNYQEKLKDKETLNETLTEVMTELKNKNDEMKSTVEATERIQKENEGLLLELAGLQSQMEQMRKEAEQVKKTADLEKMQALHDQQMEYEKLISENKQEILELKSKHMEAVETKMQALHDQQTEYEKLIADSKQAMLDLKTKHMEQVEAVQTKMQEQVNRYQTKYMELLEKMGHDAK